MHLVCYNLMQQRPKIKPVTIPNSDGVSGRNTIAPSLMGCHQQQIMSYNQFLDMDSGTILMFIIGALTSTLGILIALSGETSSIIPLIMGLLLIDEAFAKK